MVWILLCDYIYVYIYLYYIYAYICNIKGEACLLLNLRFINSGVSMEYFNCTVLRLLFAALEMREVIKLASHKFCLPSVVRVMMYFCQFHIKQNLLILMWNCWKELQRVLLKYFCSDFKVPKGQRLNMKDLNISIYSFLFLLLASVN